MPYKVDPNNPYGLTKKQWDFVGYYLGECNGNATQSALKAGYSPKTAYHTGAENLRNPKIQEALSTWRQEASGVAVAQVSKRLEEYQDLILRHWRLIKAREEYHKDFPGGGDTGLLVMSEKPTKDYGTIIEYHYDGAVIDKLTSLYAQVAKESGTEKLLLEVSGPDGSPVKVEETKLIDFSDLSDAALRELLAKVRDDV